MCAMMSLMSQVDTDMLSSLGGQGMALRSPERRGGTHSAQNFEAKRFQSCSSSNEVHCPQFAHAVQRHSDALT